jgi:hypothetical protein
LEYKSKSLRRAENAYSHMGGIRDHCLLLYRNGLSYQLIAKEIKVPFGTLQRYMTKWRRDTKR